MPPPCDQCTAACCRLGPHGWKVGAMIDNKFVSFVDGKCPMLGDNNRCTVYGTPNMPENCQNYTCETDTNFLAVMPDVSALLHKNKGTKG